MVNDMVSGFWQFTLNSLAATQIHIALFPYAKGLLLVHHIACPGFDSIMVRGVPEFSRSLGSAGGVGVATMASPLVDSSLGDLNSWIPILERVEAAAANASGTVSVDLPHLCRHRVVVSTIRAFSGVCRMNRAPILPHVARGPSRNSSGAYSSMEVLVWSLCNGLAWENPVLFFGQFWGQTNPHLGGL